MKEAVHTVTLTTRPVTVNKNLKISSPQIGEEFFFPYGLSAHGGTKPELVDSSVRMAGRCQAPNESLSQ